MASQALLPGVGVQTWSPGKSSQAEMGLETGGGWHRPGWELGYLQAIPVTFCLSSSVIVTEKTNILLRYLHQQWDKKVRSLGFKCQGLGHNAQHWSRTRVAVRPGVQVGP